ncbi:dipeptidase PepV [Staphylococcus gallinarum]|uniref:Dipeptidase PepV n=1 Tax=Staphylococcus gallinarum TaxID=1293 RepID=A0A380FJY0_STAGA|nr:dipeptidase PepV [Staphylococcus gallinarum]
MGMKYHTEIMGDVTTNIGVIEYNNTKGGKFGINLRYPEGSNLMKRCLGLQKK